MDTITVELRRDHDNHRRLLALLVDTSGDSAERRAMFAELKNDLEAHANAEERSLYAKLMRHEKTQPTASHGAKEHHDLSELLTQLEDTDGSDPQWLVRLKHLKERVEHHESEEEQDVFPYVDDVLSDAERADLSEVFYQEKSKELAKAR